VQSCQSVACSVRTIRTVSSYSTVEELEDDDNDSNKRSSVIQLTRKPAAASHGASLLHASAVRYCEVDFPGLATPTSAVQSLQPTFKVKGVPVLN
jgi:hypothetical protein